ncbi:hypothetical protein Droror1_Dr00020173, partial [Drosera rotundifolia]
SLLKKSRLGVLPREIYLILKLLPRMEPMSKLLLNVLPRMQLKMNLKKIYTCRTPSTWLMEDSNKEPLDVNARLNLGSQYLRIQTALILHTILISVALSFVHCLNRLVPTTNCLIFMCPLRNLFLTLT